MWIVPIFLLLFCLWKDSNLTVNYKRLCEKYRGSLTDQRFFFNIFVDPKPFRECVDSLQRYEASFAHSPSAGTLEEFLGLRGSGYLTRETAEPA